MTKQLSFTDNKPIRVLHVLSSLRPGGSQTLIMKIYRNIDRDRVQFDFAVRTQKPDYYDEEIQSLGGRIFHLPWETENPLSFVSYKNALENILKNDGPFHVVHSHSNFHSGYILQIANKAEVQVRIAHSHNTAVGKTSWMRNLWAQLMRRKILNNATHLLACSPAAAKFLYGSQFDQDNRYMLLPNAIDLDPYEKSNDDQTLWREKTGLPVDGYLIGHIGRFDKQKNHALLLQIFVALLEIIPEARLILVGEGDLQQQMKHYAVEKGIVNKVHFLGVRLDVPEILAALDVFVFPSFYEGLGIVLIEAQAAGVPCVASDKVPEEVDLGLGLVQFISLDLNTQVWAQVTKKAATCYVPVWKERKTVLKERGYDIQRSAVITKNLYLGAEALGN